MRNRKSLQFGEAPAGPSRSLNVGRAAHHSPFQRGERHLLTCQLRLALGPQFRGDRESPY